MGLCVRVGVSPGVDEVLCQADAGRRAGDGDLTVGRAVHWVGDLDLGAGHLTNLVDLGALATDDAPNQLWRKEHMSKPTNPHTILTSTEKGYVNQVKLKT